MDARFTAMEDEAAASGALCARRAALVAATLVSTVSGAFSQCLSGVRRPHAQFDAEHQRSLLSCVMPDDMASGDSRFKPQSAAPGPEAAMIELRRRVMGDGAMAAPSKWKQRRMQQKRKQDEQRRSTPPPTESSSSSSEVAALLSDTTLAIDELLGTSSKPGETLNCSVKLEDVRRLSVDELLALSPTPEKTGGNPEETDPADIECEAAVTKDGARLRSWLSSIDASRATEFRAYAAAMERHGFQSLADLAQLDEQDVETAMSEIGISKFAHRLRIRKAIRELHVAQASAVAPMAPAVAAMAAA